MKKLYITPRSGYLNKTIDHLKQQGYRTTVIGHGFPPLFVEAQQEDHDKIRDMIVKIDESAEFSSFRLDQIDEAKIYQILMDHFREEDLKLLCWFFKIDYDEDLPTGAKSQKAKNFITYCQERNRTTELIEKIDKLRPQVTW